MSGLVYFVRVRPDGPIKIGFTGDPCPETRLGSLQVGCPWEIDLIGSAAGDLTDEHRLHARLEPYRMRGEWFSPHEKVLKAIEGVLKDGFPLSYTPRAVLRAPPVSDPKLEELRERAQGLIGATHLHLPPDLSVVIRRASECAGVSPEELIIDILRDVFPARAVSRETAIAA